MSTLSDAGAPADRLPALSPSRAADFKQCPLLYRYRAIDRFPETPTVAQTRGTLVHAALEHLFDMPSALRTRESAEYLVEGAWAALCEGDPRLPEIIGAEQTEEFLAAAQKLVDTYYRMENPRGFDAEACEVHVEVTDGDLRLRGFIDRIDVAPTGEIRLVDYKTGRSPAAGREDRAMFQMKFYALAVMKLREEVPARLQLMYLSDGQQLTYEPDREELVRFGRTLHAMWEAILAARATGEFPARRSWLCRFCEHQARCPEFGGEVPPYPLPIAVAS